MTDEADDLYVEEDEAERAADMRRAQHAHELDTNPFLRELLMNIETDFIETWRRTDPGDALNRELMWHGVQVVAIIRTGIEQAIADGVTAVDIAKRVAALKPKSRTQRAA